MSSREEIDSLLDRAYDARRRQDTVAVFKCFTPNGKLTLNGTSANDRYSQEAALQSIFSALVLVGFDEHCRVIDPPRAAVHWRGTFEVAKTNEVIETDVLDLIEVTDGKVGSLTSFFDTAAVARFLTP